MAKRSKKGRDITGIVIIDKPTGASSNFVLQQVKRLFNAKKAGHTGSLDPLATGVLPICLGEATKLSTFLLEADKQYLVTCLLGSATDSGDSDGNIIEHKPIPVFTETTLKQILTRFQGEQSQIPPMFSALKHQGQPLYKLARQGIEIERKARQVVIYAIDCIAITEDSFTLSVSCSKGTYIRTLVQDIAAELGTCGHVTMLRRTQAAGYDLQQAYQLTDLRQTAESGWDQLDACLLPAHEALPEWPQVHLTDFDSQRILLGQSIEDTKSVPAKVLLFNAEKRFIGIGERNAEGVVAPKRLFVLNPDERPLVNQSQSR